MPPLAAFTAEARASPRRPHCRAARRCTPSRPTERRAILELFERWGDIDGGYRKLAHRGLPTRRPGLGVTVDGCIAFSQPRGYVAARPVPSAHRRRRALPSPDWIECEAPPDLDLRHNPASPEPDASPYAILDARHPPNGSPPGRQAALASLRRGDLFERWWSGPRCPYRGRLHRRTRPTPSSSKWLLTAEEDTRRDCGPSWRPAKPTAPAEATTATRRPILLAMSDNGPQMRAGTTREFLALCCIAARFGRPGTPTDQAWIETLFGHVKTEWPHLEKITDPNTLRAELDIARHDYNTRRLHASLGYVTPDDEHQGRAEHIRQARRDGLNRARLTRIAYHRNNKPNQP